jgi:hypothetical protein
MAPRGITYMVIKKKAYLGTKLESLCTIGTLYQPSYDGELNEGFNYGTYEVTVKKVENKIVYYKETVECLHLILWPRSQRRVQCHTAKPEPNQRVRINQVPLLV